MARFMLKSQISFAIHKSLMPRQEPYLIFELTDQGSSYDGFADSLMTVATFAAALTGSIIFPSPAPTSDQVCEHCSLVRSILSVSFLLFTISLLSALFLKIGRRLTVPIIPDRVANVCVIVSVATFATGFLMDGVSLIFNEQAAVGGLIVAFVTIFGVCALCQVFR